MRYRHIVFDVDGTLIDTEYAVLRSLQDTIFHVTGKRAAVDELDFALGITSEAALRQLGIAEVEAAAEFWNETMQRYSHTVCLFQGIKELLAALAAQGLALGIVTSKTREEFQQDVEKFDILSCFQTVVYADDTQKHKPDPAPLRKYMELANCGGAETLYIGDSIYDMQCAAGAGAGFALAGWGAKNRLTAPVIFATPLDAVAKLTAQPRV